MTLVDEQTYFMSLPPPTAAAGELDRRLGTLAGAPAGRYAELRGVYDLVGCTLSLDYLPPDPETEPAVLRVGVKAKRVQLDSAAYSTPERRRACEDYLARQVAKALNEMQADDPPDGSAGALWLPPLGQEVLERTALRVGEEGVVLRLFAALPVRQGKILAPPAADLLLRRLPRLVERALTAEVISDSSLRRHLAVVEDQNHIRTRLQGQGLVAFLGNGAVLPRRTDGSDLPREREQRVEFRTPERLSVTLNAPNAGAIIGTGIPVGVTVIVGGAEHGKSTLLAALERGVYDHIPGDGRERVTTHRRAVRVTAEPGRVVHKVDLRPFVQSLPGGQPVDAFETDNASPCLSQAAGLMEALEAGATVLLIDEDASAPNFLYRDARMQQLVGRDHEPLTVLLDQARELYNRLGVSTIIATGSGGDYLELADTVIMMDHYSPLDVTSRARTIAAAMPTRRQNELRRPVFRPESRVPPLQTIPDLDLTPETLSSVSSRFVEPAQTAAMQLALRRLTQEHFDGERNLPEALYALEQEIDRYGLEILYPESTLNHPPLSRPRAMDLAAVLNRLPHFLVEVTPEAPS